MSAYIEYSHGLTLVVFLPRGYSLARAHLSRWPGTLRKVDRRAVLGWGGGSSQQFARVLPYFCARSFYGYGTALLLCHIICQHPAAQAVGYNGPTGIGVVSDLHWGYNPEFRHVDELPAADSSIGTHIFPPDQLLPKHTV